jgi:hypothetical protein
MATRRSRPCSEAGRVDVRRGGVTGDRPAARIVLALEAVPEVALQRVGRWS